MKWIGQHIYDLIARFRSDVYLEDLDTTTETNVLVVDSDGKVSKTTVITGDVTGVTAGDNITVTDPTGPVPTVTLNTTLTGLTSITSTSFIGSLTGNATTVTTNANLTGHITSVGNAAVLGSFTSGQLSTALGAGVTGTGRAVFATGPTLITPVLGVASATSINKLTIIAPSAPAELVLVGGSALITAGAFETTLTSTATTNVTLPTTGTLATLGGTETLSGKTLTAPTITGAGAIAGVFTGNLTGNVTGNADTATKIDTITNTDIVQLTGVQTLTDKTLTSPVINTPTGIVKGDVGLGSVDNTADTAKPVSTAQQTALNLKANLASPTFTGTVGGITAGMVGLGSVNNTADTAKPVSTAQQTALDLKANLASPTFTGTVGGITKAMVGLGSVDNTADTAKPVSTAQQTALDLKGDLASPTFTGKISLNDGGNSVFVGDEAGLNDDASNNRNVGVGRQALHSNTTGANNSAVGYAALLNNTTGNINTANGYEALRSNTTGSSNTANGYLALYSNTTGDANTANGYGALRSNTTGSSNTANGGSALYNNTTGSNNIAVGRNAGTYITGGVGFNTVTDNSVFLGQNTKALADSQTNQIVIGYDTTGLGSNTAILGNSSITTTRLQGGIEINASDTTITRAEAGRIAVEGVNVVTTSSTDTLTNKTLTAPAITGAGAIAGVFTGNITGDVTGNADTVTTNADLTGPVTSTGNATAIADGAITTAMQKHLQTFEFNGYISPAASTNYFIPTLISVNTGPFNHNVDAGAGGVTALTPAVLSRSGGKVMPYAGTCKLWKGWIGVTGGAAFKVSIFKYTPVPDDATPDSLVLVKEFSDAADGNNNLIAISEDDGFVNEFDAGDILITGISCASGATAYFTSTLEVEWD
jgi:hypothetical protein